MVAKKAEGLIPLQSLSRKKIFIIGVTIALAFIAAKASSMVLVPVFPKIASGTSVFIFIAFLVWAKQAYNWSSFVSDAAKLAAILCFLAGAINLVAFAFFGTDRPNWSADFFAEPTEPSNIMTGIGMLAIASMLAYGLLYLSEQMDKIQSYSGPGAILDLIQDLPAIKDFLERFEEEKGAWLDEQEAERKSARRARVIIYIIGLPISCLFAAALLTADLEKIPTILLALPFVITWGLAEMQIKALKEDIKQKIMPSLIKALDLERMDKNNSLPTRIYEEAQLIPQAQYQDVKEGFVGSYHKVPFAMSHVTLTSGRGRSKYVTFNGILIHLTFPKSFNNPTLILRDRTPLGKIIERKRMGIPRINLVYPEFEKIFEVYAQDQIEARDLLSPDVLEGLVKLGDIASDYSWIQAAFIGESMLIAIPVKGDPFDIRGSLREKMAERGFVRRFVAEIGLVHMIIDALDMKRRTNHIPDKQFASADNKTEDVPEKTLSSLDSADAIETEMSGKNDHDKHQNDGNDNNGDTLSNILLGK